MSIKLLIILINILISHTNLEHIEPELTVSPPPPRTNSAQKHPTQALENKLFWNFIETSNKTLNEVQKRIEELEKRSEKEKRQMYDLQETLKLKESEILNEIVSLRNEINNVTKTPKQVLPKNCKEVLEQGNIHSGFYLIKPKSKKIKVQCDMDLRGGGWTVIQKRFDGSQDFNMAWKDYARGFGNLSREFWLGLKYLHELTEFGNNELLIHMVNKNQTEAYAYYEDFAIGNQQTQYMIKVLSDYSGTAGDSLEYHLGSRFSAKDQDNSNSKCMDLYEGGWWFSNGTYCHYSNLNGQYSRDGDVEEAGTGLNWHGFSTDSSSLMETQMLVRPR